MSYNGSGVYTLPGAALANGEIVSATENNQSRNDFAAALNIAWCRDGQAPATGNIPMGGYKLTGLGVAATSGDALSYGQAATVSTLTASSTVTISSGTANGVAYLNGSKVLTTGSGLVFDGSNLGLGVTPESWYSSIKVFRVGTSGALWYYSNGTYLSNNFYADSAGVSKYISNGYAQQYMQDSGQHIWKTAPSGTAGNAITFTQAMTLDASGNLGIGTSSPTTKLQIEGSTGAARAITLSDTGGATPVILGNTISGGTANFVATVGGSERMRIDSSGNVGIGTSSPGGRLQLTVPAATENTLRMTGSTTATCFAQFQNTSGNFYLGVDDSTGSGFGSTAYSRVLYASGAYPMVFFTNGTERMSIDSSGKIYANTTDTASQDGQLNVKVTVAGAQSIDLWNSATSGTRYHMKFRDNSTATVRGSITSDGTNTAFNTSSDYRLKEDIKDLPNALEIVNKLQPRQFNWKETGKKTTGFIAHELQAVVPDCVTGEKDAVDEEGNPVYQGIDTSFLVATLTKAIQELKAELDATKAEVAALKAK